MNADLKDPAVLKRIADDKERITGVRNFDLVHIDFPWPGTGCVAKKNYETIGYADFHKL